MALKYNSQATIFFKGFRAPGSQTGCSMKFRRVLLIGLLIASIGVLIGVRIYTSRLPSRIGTFSDEEFIAARRLAGDSNEPAPTMIVQTPIDYSKRVRVSIGSLGLRGDEDQKVAALTLANLSAARGVELIEREELEKALQEIHMLMDGFVRAKDTLQVGQILHADWFVLGSWYDFNGTNSVVIRIVDAHTGVLRAARFLDGDSSPAQMAAELAEIVQNARSLATTTNPPVFVGLSGFDNVGVNDRLADFPQQLRAGLTAEYRDSHITLVERERVGFLLHEMALDASGFADSSNSAPFVPQPAFWIVGGSYQSYETTQRTVELRVEIDQVFGTLREKSFRVPTGAEAVAAVKSYVDQTIAARSPAVHYSRVTEASWYLDVGKRIAGLTPGSRSSIFNTTYSQQPTPMEARNIREAMSAFQSAVLLEPTNRPARLYLAQCLKMHSIGKYEEAREMLKSIIDEGVRDQWKIPAEMQMQFRYEISTENMVRWLDEAAAKATNAVAADFYKSASERTRSWAARGEMSADTGKSQKEILFERLKQPGDFDSYRYFYGLEGGKKRQAMDELISSLPEIKSTFSNQYFNVLAAALKEGADTNALVADAFASLYKSQLPRATNSGQAIIDLVLTLNDVATASAKRTNYGFAIDIFTNLLASSFAHKHADMTLNDAKMSLAYTLENAGRWQEALDIFETYSNRPLQMANTGVYGDGLTLVFPHMHARHCRKELGLPPLRDPRQFSVTNDVNWGGPFCFSAESGSIWVGAKNVLWNLSADGEKTNSSTTLPISREDAVTALYGAPDEIWLGTRASGLLAVNRRTKSVRQWKQADGLLMDSISSLAMDGKILWIGYGQRWREYSGSVSGSAKGGLGCMDLETGHFTTLGHSMNREIKGGPETFVSDMIVPVPNELWYIAGYGIFHYVAAEHTHTSVLGNVLSMSADSGIIAATGNNQKSPLGLSILDPASKKWMPVFEKSDAPIGNASLVRVLNGSVWLGGLGFVASIDPKESRVRHFAYINSPYGIDDLQWSNGELWGRKDWWLFHARVPAD